MAIPVLKLAAFLAAAVLAAPASAQAQAAVAVEAQAVGLSSMVDTIRAIGTIRANQSIVMRSEIPGVVNKIDFADSQSVGKGEVLFRLDDAMDRAQLAQAEAALKLTESNYARAQELVSRGAGTSAARDQTMSARDADMV